MKLIFLFILLIAISFSCQKGAEKNNGTEILPIKTQQFVNWETMNEFNKENMSFPNWFNETVIKEKNIQQIALTFTNYNTTDSVTIDTDTLPYKIQYYNFNPMGEITSVEIHQYISGVKISEDDFIYNQVIDSFGYSFPIIKSKIQFGKKKLRDETNLDESHPYSILKKIEHTDEYIEYIDEYAKNKATHIFILDSSNWNVSYIDLKFRPQRNELFYYGAPQSYSTSFSVRNLVEKSIKTKQLFYSNEVLKSQWFFDKYFVTKRHYTYDSDGLCVGFSDSLKTIDEEFIHLEIGEIQYEKDLPKQLSYFNEEDNSFTNPLKTIVFHYK